MWGERHFSSVPHALFTLLVEGILPDQAYLVHAVGAESPVSCGILIIFLIFCVFFLTNMLIGVLCDVISRKSMDGEYWRQIEQMSESLESLLLSM
eukprot:CAMPEP_0204605508 /NCGR_PEP_ID=MMETSP0661-20131031/58525_1 /ASSEMBLY_ACC=CAM_ASM_000606 /TAXON_ID=109239 /ORGANISM="Alexandrium margalefi, Strain AMGDE01CS-322" /LENGTH=94 /DNA_ID=CAMNT_0051616757 /DNA_START=13 /DNA_END=294 /DNA_ORIENTATION=+